MLKRIILAGICALSLASCGTARFFSGFSPEVAGEGVAMLAPVSAIFYLDDRNAEYFSDSLSFQSEGLIEQLAYGLPLNIRESIPLNEDQREEAVRFLRNVEQLSWDKMQTVPVPAALDSLVEASGERYALFIFTEGMMRDMKGYAKEAALSAVLSIASVAAAVFLGGGAAVTSMPKVAANHIHAIVLDSQIDRIVYFNRDFRDEDIHPLNAEEVDRQLRRVFKPFLK